MPTINKPKKKRTINDTKRKERQAIYQTSRWRCLRRMKLIYSPLCEICKANGKSVSAIDVHHKDSFLNYSGDMQTMKAYDYNNLMSLCKQCHQKLHNTH
jgi:5-methylcytosine-specific restriction protein A